MCSERAPALAQAASTDGYRLRRVQTPPGVLHFKTDCSLLDGETILSTKRLDASGCFNGYRVIHTAEGEDGFDTLAWIVEQRWCNGRIGSMGLSYAAHTQAALATDISATRPKAQRQPSVPPIQADNGMPMTDATDQPRNTNVMARPRCEAGTSKPTQAAA